MFSLSFEALQDIESKKMYRAPFNLLRRSALQTVRPLRNYSSKTHASATISTKFAAVLMTSMLTAGALYATTNPTVLLEGKKEKIASEIKGEEANKEGTKELKKGDAKESKNEESTAEEGGDSDGEKPQQQSAYNPDTGEINWDCPCLGGMAHGPCGEEFKEAFSCFVYSEAEPKGIDCVEKFRGMQECFRRYPEYYAEQIKDEEDAAAAAAQMESENEQVGEIPEAQLTTPETSSDVKQEEAIFEPVLEQHEAEKEQQADVELKEDTDQQSSK